MEVRLQQIALCLCIGIVWLCVEGIKCGSSVQQVVLCVCISALCGCEWRELKSHVLRIINFHEFILGYF